MLEFEDHKAPESPSRLPLTEESPRPEKRTAAKLPQILAPRKELVPGRTIFLVFLARSLILLGAFATYYGYRHQGALTELALLSGTLAEDPEQVEVVEDSFTLNYRGQDYVLEPLADYQFGGLVVTRNDISAFDDIYHDANSVDVIDICVVWGSNLNSELLGKFSFWSEPWTCNYQTDSSAAMEEFAAHQLSNNHLLPASESIGKTLSQIRRGDQVKIRGKLVSYYQSGQEAYPRTSSLSRFDSGNGACEVIYVESAEILSRGTPLAYRLTNWGVGALLLGLTMSLYNFVVLPLSRPRH